MNVMELRIALIKVMKISQLAEIAQIIEELNANTLMDLNLSLTTLQNALRKKVKQNKCKDNEVSSNNFNYLLAPIPFFC